MMMILILCVFFAFGALFSTMYLEVKMMRISMDDFYDRVLIDGAQIQINNSDIIQ